MVGNSVSQGVGVDPVLRFSGMKNTRKSTLSYGPITVKTETFRELWAPLVHTFSWGNSYGPMVLKVLLNGRLIFMHVQCWEVLPFLTNQRQWWSCALRTLKFIHRWHWIVKKDSTSQHRRCMKIGLPLKFPPTLVPKRPSRIKKTTTY